MKQQIQMASKLYECQDSAKILFGSEYDKKNQWYKDVIQAHQKKSSKKVLESAIELRGLKTVKESGVSVMCFMAAAVELMENDENKTKQK